MTVRHNLCPNPKAGTNLTGWTSNGTLTRGTGLTGFPSGVTTGGHWVSNGFVQMPTAAVTPGQQVTASFYLKNATGFAANSKDLYLAFDRSVGGTDFSQVSQRSYPDAAVTRVSITGTAPANATGVYLIIDGINGAPNANMDISAVLYELTASLDTYFDGDSANSTWDGTAQNSASTFDDSLSTVPFTSDLDLRWAVRQGFTSDLDLRWAVRAAFTSDLSLRWRVGDVSGTRDAIASAVSTVEGLTGYRRRPKAPKVGDAWPLWRGSERSDGWAFVQTWMVVVVLPGDEATADEWADQYGAPLFEALEPVMFVDKIEPAAIAASSTDMYALQITGRTE